MPRRERMLLRRLHDARQRIVCRAPCCLPSVGFRSVRRTPCSLPSVDVFCDALALRRSRPCGKGCRWLHAACCMLHVAPVGRAVFRVASGGDLLPTQSLLAHAAAERKARQVRVPTEYGPHHRAGYCGGRDITSDGMARCRHTMPRGIACEARGPRRDALLHAMLCANDTIARRTGGNKPRPAVAYYGYCYYGYSYSSYS